MNVPEQRPRVVGAFGTGPPPTAGGSHDDGLAIDLVLADRIADLLAIEPTSCNALARQLRRRKADVLAALTADPARFERVGSGRRWSRWALADVDARTGAREQRESDVTAEPGPGLPPATEDAQTASVAHPEDAVATPTRVRARARGRRNRRRRAARIVPAGGGGAAAA